MIDTPSPILASEPTVEKKNGPAREAFELGKTIVGALLIALVLRVLLFQPFTIPSASMVPTLLVGDYLVASKYSYGWSRHSIPFSPPIFKGRIFGHDPARGDIVLFKLPRDGHTDYIKRLIGLPGDKVQVKQGVVFINGKAVEATKEAPKVVEEAFGFPREIQPYDTTLGDKHFTTYSADPGSEVENTDVYTVPAGQYFVMGDNRDNSLDSRFPTEIGVGFVPAENLVGRAEIVLFSWKEGASLFKPWTWVTDVRLSRFGKRL